MAPGAQAMGRVRGRSRRGSGTGVVCRIASAASTDIAEEDGFAEACEPLNPVPGCHQNPQPRNSFIPLTCDPRGISYESARTSVLAVTHTVAARVCMCLPASNTSRIGGGSIKTHCQTTQQDKVRAHAKQARARNATPLDRLVLE